MSERGGEASATTPSMPNVSMKVAQSGGAAGAFRRPLRTNLQGFRSVRQSQNVNAVRANLPAVFSFISLFSETKLDYRAANSGL